MEANYTTQTVEVVQTPEPSDLVGSSEFQSHYGPAERVQLDLRPAELLEEQKAIIPLVHGRDAPRRASGREAFDSPRIADEAPEMLSSGEAG
jgi:hypothetical protein